jgi:glucosamine-6-phosphate deaminase
MTIHTYNTYEDMSEATADLIQEYILSKPKSMICIASGSTPLGLCKVLERRVKNGDIDIKDTTFVALDEWVGMGPDDEGSCQHFLKHHLFQPLNISQSNIVQFDAKSDDLDAECNKVNEVIAANGGLDIIIVGIGMNGHLGLNEPGTPFETYAHVSILEEITKSVGQKYFSSTTPLTRGITLGLKHIAEAKVPVIIASGENKADIISKTVSGEVGTDIPSTLFQTLSHGKVILDLDAAKFINQ